MTSIEKQRVPNAVHRICWATVLLSAVGVVAGILDVAPFWRQPPQVVPTWDEHNYWNVVHQVASGHTAYHQSIVHKA